MKLKLFLVFLTALALAGKVSANSDELVLDSALDSKESMTWPMLPGESLNELAAKFYPKNKVMQRQFTFKTISLNADSLHSLDASTDFSAPTALIVPTLKSLSYNTGANKSAHKKSSKQQLHLSYNIKAAVEGIPQTLVAQYEYLVSRNTFLKDELAKLNEKLVFLKIKLDNLKLIFDKTLVVPQKKVFKNLDAKIVVNTPANQAKNAPIATQSQPILRQISNFIFDPVVRIFWISALLLCFIVALSSYYLKKYREKLFDKLSLQASLSEPVLSPEKKQTAPKEPVSALGADTTFGEQSTGAILDEAKVMVSKGQHNDAIEHLKWAIRAKPKKAINLWLYMLQIFREQNLQEEFENYAKALHQTFNVLTPVWEEKSVAMVVAQSLEEFPHITEKLTAIWPNEAAGEYLRSLINDNRDGERVGFGKAVLDEILLLVAVLEARADQSKNKASKSFK